MILRKYTVAVALIFSVLSSAAAPNATKFKELFAKYEECYDANDYHGSVKYLEEAMPYIHPDSIIWFSDAYNGLSYAYYDLGQYDKAIAYGNRSLECDLQIGDSTRISTSFNLLAVIFAHQRRFDEAERYMHDAIAYVPLANTRMRAGRYAVLGEILSAVGKNDEAVGYIRKAYTLDSTDNRTDKMPVRLSQLGTVYLSQKDYAKAEVTLARATDGLRAIGNNYSLCINLMVQTKNYIALGRKAEAEKTATECLALSTRLDKRKTKLDALRLLAELRQSPELYEQALKLNDSLYNEQISEQIADFEARYATAEKEKEAAQLQVVVNRQRYALIVFVLVFAALLVGTVLVHFARRMRRDIEHTEKVARELFVSHSKQNAVSVKPAIDAQEPENESDARIRESENQSSETEKVTPESIENQVTAAQEPAVDSDEIQLSPREVDIVKACCQGKLSKEIADEFGISKKTVDNHKSAIYQKLGICNNTELILYAVKHGIAKL